MFPLQVCHVQLTTHSKCPERRLEKGLGRKNEQNSLAIPNWKEVKHDTMVPTAPPFGHLCFRQDPKTGTFSY